MAKNSEMTVITPVLTKDVSFNEKVEAVDTALKVRSAAQKDIKIKWAGVVKLLQKYDLTVPARRPDPSTVVGYIKATRAYEPQPEVTDEMKATVKCEGSYQLMQLRSNPDMLKLMDKKFPDFKDWLESVGEARQMLFAPKKEDEDATKAAQEEMATAVDAYIASLEAYDETIESVASVKEYIGIMKDIADISAIAQGVKTKE